MSEWGPDQWGAVVIIVTSLVTLVVDFVLNEWRR